LVEHLILQICKITDEEESFGRKNLTVKFLVNNSDFSTAPGESDKLKRLTGSMDVFREKIRPARNRLIGHLDRLSVLDGNALGADHVAVWSAHRMLDDHFVLCVDSDLNIVADANLCMRGHRPAVWIDQRYLGLASSFELRRHHFVGA